MIGTLSRLGGLCPCLPILLIALLAPAATRGESIRFYNETNATVIIQTAVVQGRVKSGPTLQVPASSATPAIALPGNKIITIIDPRMPTRILFRGTIPASLADQEYNIVRDTTFPQLKLETRKAAPKGP